MNDRTVIVAACLLAGGLFFALRAMDTAKPDDAGVATPTGCDCGTAETADGKNSVGPIEDLPAGASNIKSLGNGWLQFQVDLAGYRRVFIYRRGGSLAELSHLSQYIGGTGAAPAKPGSSGKP